MDAKIRDELEMVARYAREAAGGHRVAADAVEQMADGIMLIVERHAEREDQRHEAERAEEARSAANLKMLNRVASAKKLVSFDEHLGEVIRHFGTHGGNVYQTILQALDALAAEREDENAPRVDPAAIRSLARYLRGLR